MVFWKDGLRGRSGAAAGGYDLVGGPSGGIGLIFCRSLFRVRAMLGGVDDEDFLVGHVLFQAGGGAVVFGHDPAASHPHL